MQGAEGWRLEPPPATRLGDIIPPSLGIVWAFPQFHLLPADI